MKKFVSWLGGIAATVIAGVLIYKLTAPTPPPPPPPQITFEGMAIDKEHFAPIKDVLVSLEINGARQADVRDLTDEHGSYGIKLTGLDKASNVRVVFQANGYHDGFKEFPSLNDDNRYDPLLTAVPTPPPLHGGTPTPTPETTIKAPPRYIPKLSLRTFKLAEQIQRK